MWNCRGFVCLAAALTISTVSLAPACAQDYPTRPIKVIIPNPPGGPGDIIARVFADKASQSLGKPFIFEYKPGASTTIGNALAAKADPDGYTILGLPSSGVGAAALKKQLRYNIESDFSPIAGIGSVPLVLIVHARSDIKSMDEFSAAVRAGKLTFASAGVGTIGFFSSFLLANEIGGTASHVPYRGNPQALQAVVGGYADFSVLSVSDVLPYANSKEVLLLATTADQRLAELPNVPTMSEVGLPNVNAKLWYAFLAPTKTPANVITRLYDAFAEAGKAITDEKQLRNFGFTVEMRNPDETKKLIKDEVDRWKKVIEVNHIPLEE